MLEINIPEAKTESTMSTKSEATPPQPKSQPRFLVAMLGRHESGEPDGASAIEYALIASGIGAAVAATVYSFGTSTANLYQSIANMF
jgi:Flp pilus assembly pilin Flp